MLCDSGKITRDDDLVHDDLHGQRGEVSRTSPWRRRLSGSDMGSIDPRAVSPRQRRADVAASTRSPIGDDLTCGRCALSAVGDRLRAGRRLARPSAAYRRCPRCAWAVTRRGDTALVLTRRVGQLAPGSQNAIYLPDGSRPQGSLTFPVKNFRR